MEERASLDNKMSLRNQLDLVLPSFWKASCLPFEIRDCWRVAM